MVDLVIVVVIVVVDFGPALENPGDGQPPCLHGAAHAPKEHGAEEAGVRALGEKLTEALRLPVGVGEVRRERKRLVLAVAMQPHLHRGEARLARLRVKGVLQVLAGAEDDGTKVGIVVFEEAGEAVLDSLPVRCAQPLGHLAGGEGRFLRKIERAAEDREVTVLGRGRKRVAQPVPALEKVRRRSHPAEEQAERGPGVPPAAARPAEDRVRAAPERVEQIEGFDGVDLHRGRGGEQQASRAR